MFGDAVDLAVLILVVALLYASVRQAGASGYLAAKGLLSFDPAAMKPTALVLNVLVAGIGTVQFWRAGLFFWRSFCPFGVLGCAIAHGRCDEPAGTTSNLDRKPYPKRVELLDAWAKG